MIEVWLWYPLIAILIKIIPTSEHDHRSDKEQTGACNKNSFLDAIISVIGIQEWILPYILQIYNIDECCSNNVHN